MTAEKKKDAPNIPFLMAPFRARIDALDDEIVALLAKRIGIIREVAHFKKQQNIPAILQDRVDEVINRNTKNAEQKNIDARFAKQLYTHIVTHCCAIEDAHLKGDNI